MAHNLDALTEKEKQTLRLLLAGHDAKSMARQLGLSVHTINERLRDARRKLSASSSREAARMLREAEDANPERLGDKGLGDAAPGPAGQRRGPPGAGWSAQRRKAWAVGGFAMLALAIADALALSASPDAARERAEPSRAAARAPAAEPAATQAAREWLALVDAGQWQQSWAATAQSFRSVNTVAMWQSASEQARVPLGRVLSRRAGGEESIPAPPNGYRLVRFATDFAGRAGATETLTLVREGDGWRVSGYFIE